MIKPYRTYLRKRTLGNFRQQIASMNQCHNSFDPSTIISIINSYLGMCRYHQSYHIRQKLLSGLGDRFYDLYEFDDDLLVCRTKDIHHDAS
ncbi:MAG: hypothetical protein H6766_06660 [Candidatus Peribacteria bacterium]|nr:MAG: hypothetical protein H6766_06660 [Candidatus Peribacteria bacterium]